MRISCLSAQQIPTVSQNNGCTGSHKPKASGIIVKRCRSSEIGISGRGQVDFGIHRLTFSVCIRICGGRARCRTIGQEHAISRQILRLARSITGYFRKMRQNTAVIAAGASGVIKIDDSLCFNYMSLHDVIDHL
jgi:hypothetical protein